MDEQETVASIINLLKDDEYLSGLAGAAVPQVILMPFAHDKHKNYVMIGLFFAEENLTRDTLISVCKYVVMRLVKNRFLNGLDGVEVLPCLVRDGRAERILRLSILSYALPSVENLGIEDIDRPEPAEGISCILYRKNF